MAFVATNVFLILQGFEIEASEPDVVDTMLRVADGSAEPKQIRGMDPDRAGAIPGVSVTTASLTTRIENRSASTLTLASRPCSSYSCAHRFEFASISATSESR